MRNYFIIIFLFFSSFTFAQSSIQVSADARYVGNKNQSIKEVETEALYEAKTKALSNAGIKEHVKVYNSLYRRTENNDYDKVVTSNFFSEIGGAVTSYTLSYHNAYISPEGLPVCSVGINANVIKYETDADYNYKAIIDGLEPAYYYDNERVLNVKNPWAGCAVKFNFTPTKDTYLTIFTLWDDEVYMNFPHEEEKKIANRDKNTIFKKDKEYEFGNQPEIWFDSVNKSTGYRLVIVIHKEERRFFETLNVDNMWKWIWEIPRELRAVTIKDFTVYNNK